MARLQRDIGLILRCIYALCLLGATYNHATIVLAHGLFWDYGGAPWFTCTYWTLLTFLDPLAAVLLFARPRAGLALTVAIITSDVIHNAWISWHYQVGLNAMFLSQVAFLLFVWVTVGAAWRRTPPSADIEDSSIA